MNRFLRLLKKKSLARLDSKTTHAGRSTNTLVCFFKTLIRGVEGTRTEIAIRGSAVSRRRRAKVTATTTGEHLNAAPDKL